MNNEEKVKALLAGGKSSEDIVKFLVMNDDYRTGPEARTALEAFMQDSGLVQTKKVPMSEQYKTWYTALSRGDKMACTKQSLHVQAVGIGMSEKSADWYARVYLLAGTLALEMSNEHFVQQYDDGGYLAIEQRCLTRSNDETKKITMPDGAATAELSDAVTKLYSQMCAGMLEEHLASLHDDEYEALTIAKRKAFDKKATAAFNQ